MKTTLCGLISALALAAHSVPGLPVALYPWLVVLSTCALAALGYHAQDCPPTCPNRKVPLALLIGACLVLCAAGCASGGLALEVSNPTFGKAGVVVEGISFGRHRTPTNLVPAIPPL